MPYSSLTKTRWSSDSDRREPAESETAAGAALIELNDVSLRFVNYADKQYSLKRAVLDLVLRRESPAPSRRVLGVEPASPSRSLTASAWASSGGNGAGKSTLCGCWRRSIRRPRARCRSAATSPRLIEMGAGFNPSSPAPTTSCSTARCSASAGARCWPRSTGSTNSPACVSSPTAAQVLFQRHVHAAGLCDRHRGRSRHPADRRIARRRRRRVPRKGQGPDPRLLDRSKVVILVSHDLDRCASCARAGSGSSTASLWRTARSTRSSTVIWNVACGRGSG